MAIGAASVVVARGVGSAVAFVATGGDVSSNSNLSYIASIATAISGVLIALIYANGRRPEDPDQPHKKHFGHRQGDKERLKNPESTPDSDPAMQKQLDEIQHTLAELAKREHEAPPRVPRKRPPRKTTPKDS